jgi:surface protein
MKSRLLFIIALLVTALGGAKAQTYTVNITQGCTLNTMYANALSVLKTEGVITINTSGSTTTIKTSSGTTLFTYNSQNVCSLPATTSSANNLTRHIINTSQNILLPGYTDIALKFPDPEAYAVYTSSNTTLTFRRDHERSSYASAYLLNTGTNTPGWSGKNVTKVVFDSSFANARPTSCYKWFDGMSSLTTITGIANLNTSSVTNMSYMFYGCTGFTSLDLSGTTNFTITSSTNTYYMFGNMGNLKTLSLGSSLVANLYGTACSGIGTTTTPCTLIYPTTSHPSFTTVTPDYVKWKAGYFVSANMKPYAHVDGTTLTFYYDDYSASRQGSVYDLPTNTRWPRNITSVTFHSSFANARPTSCYEWFSGMSSLTTITGIANLNTSRVTDMYCMFRNCSSLTTLNLSSLNTANVTRMYGMFDGCSGLTNLNVSNFNTTNVTDMRDMFHNCFNLTTLDLSSFTITSSTNTKGMLLCYSPSSSDVSSLQTLTVSSSLTDHLYRNACQGIGTETTPCTLKYPITSHLSFEERTADHVWWKNGCFVSENIKPYAQIDGNALTFYYDDYYGEKQARRRSTA